MRHFHKLAGNEAGHKPVSLSIWRVVIHENVIGMSASFRQALHGFFVGLQAKVDGAYGMFNYKTGGEQQIWIAGGIGLTPFLSWIRDFKGQPSEYEIDFYYCMRVPEDALFLEEIEQATAQPKNFRAHVSYSNRDGHLSVEQIVTNCGGVKGKEIYLCGPIALIQALQKAFMKLGTPAGQVHFEEFNFR